ncbi:hypothetical protein BDV97DRAFT_364492 [Delphinella strobiligena]|nr:hypothetical protein BDV97DRAFT_364492 [Delphinella strobiligena]
MTSSLSALVFGSSYCFSPYIQQHCSNSSTEFLDGLQLAFSKMLVSYSHSRCRHNFFLPFMQH